MTNFSASKDLEATALRVSFVRMLMRAFGTTFLSITSLVLGFVAFAYLPQIQDLFFDVKPSVSQGVLYWTFFYIAVVGFWIIPLAYSARLLLLQSFERIGVDSKFRFWTIVIVLPALYDFLAILFVVYGIYGAAHNLPSPSGPAHCSSAGRDSPILGVCAEVPLNDYLLRHLGVLLTASMATFAVLAVLALLAWFFWWGRAAKEVKGAFSLRALAFLAWLSTNKRSHRIEFRPEWMPEKLWLAAQRSKIGMALSLSFILALSVIVVLLHFLYHSPVWAGVASFFSERGSEFYDYLAIIWPGRATLLPIVLGAWLPALTLLALLSNRFQFPFIAAVIAVAVLSALVVGDGHEVRLLQRKPPAQKTMTLSEAVEAWKSANNCGTGNPCPRPLIVAGEGGGSRAAYLIASVLGRLEDETFDAAASNAGRRFSQQLFAISSVSGSAVGAAMYLGSLKVHEQQNQRELANRIFAQPLYFLNIVNADRRVPYLESAGAGNSQAATARATKERVERYLDIQQGKARRVTYKDALQAISSNDFLSSTITGFFARDITTLSRIPGVLDRAGILESSWEAAFARVYAAGQNPLQQGLKSFRYDPDEKANAAGSQNGSGEAQRWIPLLFANATSKETGRRVIISPVSWKKIEDDEEKSPFITSYDFDELICSSEEPSSSLQGLLNFLPGRLSQSRRAGCDGSMPPRMTLADLRLSTAAGISARSPFVSPHASIRNQGGISIDGLVDGGYFDNSGAVTAYELAKAIHDADTSLKPFVIQITSAPEWFANSEACKDHFSSPEPEAGTDDLLAGKLEPPSTGGFDVLGPISDALTVNNTRIARGFATMIETEGRLSELTNDKESYGIIKVCPQSRDSGDTLKRSLKALYSPTSYEQSRSRSSKREVDRGAVREWKNLSLSWWLSPPLQAYLDAQIYATHNRKAFNRILALLKSQDLKPAVK